MEINELCKESHEIAKDHGFYGENGTGSRNIGEVMMLIVSELGEAIEAHRKGDWTIDKDIAKRLADSENINDADYARLFVDVVKDSFQDEIADTFIRLADLCGYLDIDIDSHIRAKMRYNKTREKLHGKKY